MLVLTRKVGESIAIGTDVKIVIMQIKGKQVRLGIRADPSTAVYREEVLKKIKSENRLAGQVKKMDVDQVGRNFRIEPLQQEPLGKVVVKKKSSSKNIGD